MKNLNEDPTDQAEAVESHAEPIFDHRWPPRDRFGRREPRRFNFLTWGKIIPQVAKALLEREVPEEYWAKDADEDGWPVAVIACPCGEEPKVRLAGTATCNCNRTFVYLGTEVRVATVADGVDDQPES